MAQRQMTEVEVEVEEALETGGPLLVKKLEVSSHRINLWFNLVILSV